MATPKTISAEEITEGTVIPVRGTLVYSRLAKVVEGDALAKTDQTRTQNGMRPIGVPHTSVTLANAEVVMKDPNNPTKEETFVSERRYTSAKHPDRGQQYDINNKSSVLPKVFQLNEQNQAIQINPLEGELASGVEVIIVLRVYKPKSYNNRGLSLDQVIITKPGPVPYYSGGGVAASAAALEATGITYAATPVAQESATAGQTVTDEDGQQQAVPEGSINQGGFILPGPGEDDDSGATGYEPPAQTQAPAPQAQPQQTQSPAPQQGGESEVERLRRQLAEAEAQASAGNNSAFGAGDQAQQGPWNNSNAGIQYPGR